MHGDADEAVEELYRSDWGRIVAALIRLVGDFEIAEEDMQHLDRFNEDLRTCWDPTNAP